MRKIILLTTCQNQLNLDGRFVTSLIKTIDLLKKEEIEAEYVFIEKTDVIDLTKSQVIEEFLKSEEVSDFIFLKSNIIFEPQNIVDMLIKYEAQKIVGGSYKTNTHSKIPQLAIELDLEKTETMVGDLNLIKVSSLADGFVKINRKVFEEHKDIFDKFFFKNESKDGDTFEEQKPYYFNAGSLGADDFFKSSFYRFLNRVKNAGEDLWCHLDFNAGQIDGNYIHHYPLRDFIKMIEHFKEQQKKQKPKEEEQELN
jgi:hypothetical protein